MNKTRRITKVLTLLAILALLIATLASCGGKKQVQKLTVGNVTLQTEKVEGETVILNSLDANELTNIADMLAAAFSEDFDSREMLVAAKRGYDMTDPNFSEEGEFPDQGVNLEAALNVIKAANEKVKGTSDEIPVLPESINEADLQTLIDAFKTKVELEEEGKLLDNLLRGIGGFLNWLTKNLCFGSYLAGICLFAVIVEIVMLPFAIKQQKNTIKQAMLRPKEMAIRNKYKGRTDQVTLQKMQQEIQEFYQKENYSPYSGCLPLLIQMPIILALYQIIIDPLHYVLGQATQLSSALSQYYSASAAAGGLGGAISGNGTIALLSDIGSNAGVVEGLKSFEYFTNSQSVYEALTALLPRIPNFNIGSVNFGLTPSYTTFNVLLLVPVLTFVTYFFTSKLNRKFMLQPASNGGIEDRQAACSNNIMDVTMPLMSTVFTFVVPALVGVYWIFRSLVGLLKQFIISRIMPLPKFTEEDYKAAAKEMAGKRVVKKSENVGKVRSLHYIDDEDFEDTRERGLARRAALEALEMEKQQKKADDTPFEEIVMKEDNPNRKENKNDDKTE